MKKLLAVSVLLIFAIILASAGCISSDVPQEQPGTGTPTGAAPEVTIMYAGAGQMTMLLSTGQVDGYMVWQPFVAVATEADIGTVVEYSQDLPPAGEWTDHTCCALVAREDLIAENPGVVEAMTALTIYANDYIVAHPDESSEIAAEWLFGKEDLTFGDVTVNSVNVLKASIPTIGFATEPSEEWINSNMLFIQSLRDIGYLNGQLKDSDDEVSKDLLFDFAPYNAAVMSSATPSAEKLSSPLSFGYLPSDHHTALFVLVKEWKYFEDTYGMTLKPASDTSGKVDSAELIINGEKIADVNFVKGDGGSQLMTLMASDTIDMAYVGTPPTITAIDKGTPIKILLPVNTEGSGLVAAKSAGIGNWESFVEWAEERTREDRPLVIASPLKGSIQDVQLRFALQDAGVVVKEA